MITDTEIVGLTPSPTRYKYVSDTVFLLLVLIKIDFKSLCIPQIRFCWLHIIKGNK